MATPFPTQLQQNMRARILSQGGDPNRELSVSDLINTSLATVKPALNTPPPTPVDVVLTSFPSIIKIGHSLPTWKNGGGYEKTLVYTAQVSSIDQLVTIGNSTLTAEFAGDEGFTPCQPGTLYRVWVRWQAKNGLVSSAYGDVHGELIETVIIDENQLSEGVLEKINLIDADASVAGSVNARILVQALRIDGVEGVIEDPLTGLFATSQAVAIVAERFNELVPSLNYVGQFTSPPTEEDLGSSWTQNAVYKNLTDSRSYVLTGSPLGWVIYLEDGTSFIMTIESTNGTVFRPGQNSTTLLKARLFKNGAEVTDETPASWFRWRRVSGIPQEAPNDDATWNNLYLAGYKQISLNVDDVYARASFFCDILSP